MKVLVVGSGGREHALVDKISHSPLVSKIYVAHGNPGMLYENISGKIQLLSIKADQYNELLSFALKEKIYLTVVGPDQALADGMVDLFEQKGLLIFGPNQKASQIEWSKAHAKALMKASGILTPGYEEFTHSADAKKFVEKSNWGSFVVKCDGLALGKGVRVCDSKKDALESIELFMEKKLLGNNVDHILIEEKIEGREVSAFAICDGENFVTLGFACDHKRLLDDDMGPNTGGMGTYSPVPWIHPKDQLDIEKNVFEKIVRASRSLSSPFKGTIFAGLMKTKRGFEVLEFNARFGDPETQSLLPLLDEDLVPWLIACAKSDLVSLQIKLGRNHLLHKKNTSAVHVVMAAQGYPGTEGVPVRKGDIIQINKKFKGHDCKLYFAGVSGDPTHTLTTSGGRVLGVTGLGNSLKNAQKIAYEHINHIDFDGAQYRGDIGNKDS